MWPETLSETPLWKRVRFEERLSISPAVLQGPKTVFNAIYRGLFNRLFRYDPLLQGTVVSLRAVPGAALDPLHKRRANTYTAAEPKLDLEVTDRGFFHVRLHVEALVFSPPVVDGEASIVVKNGTRTRQLPRLYGRVVFLGTRHVALRVFGIFHAAISVDDFPGEYRREHDRWIPLAVDAPGGDLSEKQVRVGDVLCFEVKDLQHASNGIFVIRGGVPVPDANCVETTPAPGAPQADTTTRPLEYTLPDYEALHDELLRNQVERFLTAAWRASTLGDHVDIATFQELVSLEIPGHDGAAKLPRTTTDTETNLGVIRLTADAIDREIIWDADSDSISENSTAHEDPSASKLEALSEEFFTLGNADSDPLAELVAASRGHPTVG